MAGRARGRPEARDSSSRDVAARAWARMRVIACDAAADKGTRAGDRANGKSALIPPSLARMFRRAGGRSSDPAILPAPSEGVSSESCLEPESRSPLSGVVRNWVRSRIPTWPEARRPRARQPFLFEAMEPRLLLNGELSTT